MNIADIILRYIQALIWPSVVVIMVLSFRSELRRLMNAVRKFHLPGGTEVDIGDLLEEAGESAQRASDAVNSSKDSESIKEQVERIASSVAGQRLPIAVAALDLDYYRGVALSDPNLALAGLRMGLERALSDVAELAGSPQQPRTVTTARVAKVLAKRGILPQELRSLARDIAAITNAAVHGQQVTTEEALRVIDSAEPIRTFYFSWLASCGIDR